MVTKWEYWLSRLGLHSIRKLVLL